MNLDEVQSTLIKLESIKKKYLKDEQILREELFSIAEQAESYWELYTLVKKTSKNEEFNKDMMIAREVWLNKN